MNALEKYIEIADRFSDALDSLLRDEKYIGNQIDLENVAEPDPLEVAEIEWGIDKLSNDRRALFRIRNELTAATNEAANALLGLKIDATSIDKTTESAWHPCSKFHEDWFNCRAVLIGAIRIATRGKEAFGKYPGLTGMFRDAQANTKLSKSEKTYRKVVERYRETLDKNNRPTVEEMKRWLERHGNH